MWQRSRLERALGLAPWIPAVVAIGALATLLVIVAIRLTPWSAENTPLPPPQPPVALPQGSAPPVDTPAPAETGRPAVTVTPTSKPVPVGRTSTVPPPPPPPVTGRYEVLNSYPESFIGQVLISNSPGADRHWTVTLSFPTDVGDLRTSWLESLPQPTLSQAGRTFTWHSSTPLTAGTTGQLRFHFERPGTSETPSRCTTNGRACRR